MRRVFKKNWNGEGRRGEERGGEEEAKGWTVTCGWRHFN